MKAGTKVFLALAAFFLALLSKEYALVLVGLLPSTALFAANNPAIAAKLATANVATANLAGSDGWYNFFITNLVPVTLGNIVGGVVFVAGAYWFVHLKGKREN